MNSNKNLDEFIVDANILTSERVQIEPKRNNNNSKLIKETNMTIMHNKLIIQIQIMSQGGVYVYISEQNQLKKLLFEIKGSLLCQNGCQIFQNKAGLKLFLIFQDGQVIIRDIGYREQESFDVYKIFHIVSRCNLVKNNINFLAQTAANEIIQVKYENKQIYLQNFQISSWLDYFNEKLFFDFLIEIKDETHIGIMKDQLIFIQLENDDLVSSKAKFQLSEQQNKIYEVEFFPFSPFKSDKKAIFASIAIKTHTTIDIYELRLSTNIKESLQFREVQVFQCKSLQLELKKSFTLPDSTLQTKEQMFINSQYLFLTQNSKIKYANLHGNDQFKEVLNLDLNKFLVSVVANDIPTLVYDQFISILCQSPHILQQQYCNLKFQAWQFQQKTFQRYKQTEDMSSIIQNNIFNFNEYNFENFFLLLHTIFRQPLIIFDKLDNCTTPELLSLLQETFDEIHEDFIFVDNEFSRFEKQVIQEQLYSIMDQIILFIQSQDKYQIKLKEISTMKNEKILRLILATSSHLLQDLHNFYFYCLAGLYVLNHKDEEKLKNLIQFESSYYLLLSSVKLILSKQIKNYLLSQQLPEISQQTETFNQLEIMSGVSSVLRYLFDISEISKLLAYSKEFCQNTYKILKIYPMSPQIQLEYQILNLIKQYKIGDRLNHELLVKFTLYESLYGIEETRILIGVIIKKFFNQNIINLILIKYLEDLNLVLKLIDYSDKFDLTHSLSLVINKTNPEKFNQIVDIFYSKMLLKQLSNTKINKPQLMYIYKQLIFDFNEINFNDQFKVNESCVILVHQARFLSQQGLKKQALKLLIYSYNLLDFQEKNEFLLNQQIFLLINTLSILSTMPAKNRYVLFLNEITNINFFHGIEHLPRSAENISKAKNIKPYEVQLSNVWEQIDRDSQKELFVCSVIKKQPKNSLSFDQYQQLAKQQNLPDNFRFKKPTQNSLKIQQAAYYQQQLQYNVMFKPKEELDKYNTIISIQRANKLSKYTFKSKQRAIVIKQIVQGDSPYKVYNYQEILQFLELNCIQQYLLINGYRYTEKPKTMISQLASMLAEQSLQSDQEIIIISVFLIELVKFIPSEQTIIYIDKIFAICMRHKILHILLDKILKQRPSKFIVKKIVKYLSENRSTNLIIKYFQYQYTDWAVQELHRIDSDSVGEKLALGLIQQYMKAKVEGKRGFCLQPETVEALVEIKGTKEYNYVITKLIQLSKIKSQFCSKLATLQENDISYEQYQLIRRNQNKPANLEEQKSHLESLQKQLNILKKNNCVDQKAQLKRKGLQSIQNIEQILRNTYSHSDKSNQIKDQDITNNISQIYNLLRERFKSDKQKPKNRIYSDYKPKTTNKDLKTSRSLSQNSEQKSIFQQKRQFQDDKKVSEGLQRKQEILVINELKVNESDSDNNLETQAYIPPKQTKNQKSSQLNIKGQQLKEESQDESENRETMNPDEIKQGIESKDMKQQRKYSASRSTLDQSHIDQTEHSFRDSSASIKEDDHYPNSQQNKYDCLSDSFSIQDSAMQFKK